MKIKSILTILVFACIVGPAFAEIRLPAIIGDNMVLQGGMPVPVWGWASPGKTIRVSFEGRTFSTTVQPGGKWALKLGSYRPGGPYEMQISGDGADIRLHNILVGEVWLASGQSNMEFGIQTDSRAAETIAQAKDSLIHFFCVPMAYGLEPKDDIGELPAGSLNGHWVVCSPALMAKNMAWHGFSAVGYYFARELRRSTGRPVGMIASYKGGTPAQAWISLSGLRRSPAFDRYVTKHEELVKGRPQPPGPPEGGYGAPANLYNAMIAPLVPYAMKGVIWYQGESNGDRIADACEYARLFPRLINDWREKWGEGNFSFLFVQLVNFRKPALSPSEGIWPWVREAQRKALSLPRTGMAVITDVGDAVTIHPTDKYDVGVRLALAARHVAYGEKIVYSGPVYASMKIKKHMIRLHFSHAGGGLMVRGGSGLEGFGIAGADKHFVWAKAVIEGDEVVVSAEGIADPVAVRYNWADNPPGNLYDKEGLPASPFRTDDWECAVDQPMATAKTNGVNMVGAGRTAGVGRTIYKEIFAPTEDWVKEPERPFRKDLCLDGLWDFEPVPLPPGFREGVDATPSLPSMRDGVWDKVAVRVPSPWNVNSFADKNGQGGDFRTYPSYPKAWENIKMGWLRKRFTVPADWKGQRMQLHFEAVAGDAVILVNGKEVGKHFGIFLPFDVDVTAAIIPGGENEVCIGVRKASLFDKRSEYGRRTYQAGSFWGQHIAGIWQDVWLLALPQARITDVYIRPMVDSGKLVAELILRNDGNKTQTFTVDASTYLWTKHPFYDPAITGDYDVRFSTGLKMAPVTVTIPGRAEKKLVLTVAVNKELKEWSPTSPILYGLVVDLQKDGHAVDHKYTRFGWRQIRLQGDQVLLNGKPLVMKGDSWHFLGIPQMTRRYAAAWFQAMRDANLNAVRLHAQPYPSFYLDVADEMGILVLDETAVWASDGGPKLNDPAYWADSRRHLQELILRDRNHPAVFGWSVSNEVMPIVRGVMHDPPGMKDTLVKYYGVWADICRRVDPSRPWISADGEDDGAGRLPVYIVHYGGTNSMDRGAASHKPWGVGEAGNAYYGTPEQVSETNGNRAYESFLGRMEGVAASSWQTLMNERARHAVYRSVFNMVWYGLKPLPLGLKDTTRPPTIEDGVYFSLFREGEPGVQPERLGPYCTTLNPGYDPALPTYQTWPLFDAIRDAGAEAPLGEAVWGVARNVKDAEHNVKAAGHEKADTGERGTAVGAALPGNVTRVAVLAGAGSTLAAELKRTGVPLGQVVDGKAGTAGMDPTAAAPTILFIDGAHPPATDPRPLIEKVLAKAGTVVLWGPAPDKLATLNQWLPARLELSSRTASSLLPVQADPLIAGLDAAGLYFSELRPPEIVTRGLDGALVKESKVLLADANTDWQQWNKQPEYAKTAMVLRSEREAKPSGVVLIEKKEGAGRWIVTALPAAPRLIKAEKAVRILLGNLGISLGTGNDSGNPLLKGGDIVRALYCGNFPIESIQAGADENFVAPGSGEQIKTGAVVSGKKWTPIAAGNGMIDFTKIRGAGPVTNAAGYLSFWVFSTRSLEDLLLEPNIPIVDLEMTVDDAARVWLNGRSILNIPSPGSGKAEGLKLRQGWNHFLIKVVQGGSGWQFSGRLTCNQADFLATLGSALEKP